jgi:hypothetical protein
MHPSRAPVDLVPQLAAGAEYLVWHTSRMQDMKFLFLTPDAFPLICPGFRYIRSCNSRFGFHSNIIDDFTWKVMAAGLSA